MTQFAPIRSHSGPSLAFLHAAGPTGGHTDVQNGLMIAGDGRAWNHNLHFHPNVLNAIATGATSALDVGTGDGMLAVELRRILPDVVAIDTDADVLTAPAHEHEDIEWVLGDALTYNFGKTFDVVASIVCLAGASGSADAATG